MSTSPEYVTCIQRLLTEIGYRHESFPPYDVDYWGPFHVWMLNTLGPTSSWTEKQLAELEHSAGGVIERSYPHASTQVKLLFAKLTAIAILIDDSIEDEVVYEQIVQFSQRLYRGEAQQTGMLALYHATIQLRHRRPVYSRRPRIKTYRSQDTSKPFQISHSTSRS
ncbi:Terpenoid synthase [Mycena venus]|uniref:Terpenoid synthase n=1 Tax=Mycena venus TaxID=2733690 RepID=A0A8H6X927_9AGAR|nr:Terpenoid synthase [Mycena venus]